MISRKLRALRTGATLFWAVALALLTLPMSSLAQDEEEEAIEVITVTGSRVGRTNLESKVPLTIVDKAEIELKSVLTVSDLFKDMPEVAGNLLTTAISNGGGDGTSDITLRGLPSVQTLVLQNGRRLPASKFGETPDVNAIPTGAIERIEVLKDGASSLYGSDAIAGVVNIITRQDFDGFEVQGLYGLATKNSDFPNRSIDVLAGKTFDRGNITVGFNWFNQDELKSRERSISAITSGPSSAPPWTNIGDLGITLGNGSTVQFPTFADYRPFVNANETEGGDRFNFNAFTTSILELERFSLYGSANFELHELVETFVEFNFTRTDSLWRLAPTPLFALFEDPQVRIHQNQTFMPSGLVAALAGAGTVPDADGFLDIDFRRRNLELGTRNVKNEHDKKHVVGGFKGTFMEWDWEAAFNWGRTDSDEVSSGILNKTALQFALGDPAACTALAALGCVQANVFGSALAGSLTQPMLDWIGTAVSTESVAETRSFTFNVSSNDVYELPGGSIGFATGFEIRNEQLFEEPDTLLQQSATIGLTNQLPTRGDRDIAEFYGEVVVPVVDMLELDASFRWTDYDGFGQEVVPKVSGVFTPEQFVPGLRIRGSWGEGFRAPNLSELFDGGSENFGLFNDPCSDPLLFPTLPGCGVQPSDPALIQFLSLEGGNPNLEAEESETFTVGFTYELQEPLPFADALDVSLDYYNIDIDGAILSNSQFIIDQAAAGSGAFLPLVQRNPVSGNIEKITGGQVNLAKRSTQGLDLNINWTLPEFEFGQISFGLHGTHVIEFNDQPDPSGEKVDIVGHFIDAASDGLGSIPEWKMTFNTQWTRGPFMANVRVNFVDKLKEGPFGGVTTHTMESWTTVDLLGRYNLEAFDIQASITMGIDNVGNQKPPFSETGFNDNIDARTHDLIGRFWYTRVSIGF